MSAQKLLITALSALAAGVAIGLLTAPAKGSDTRQKIADSADDLKKKFRRLTGQAVDELDELKNVFEREVEGLKNDVREKVLKLIESSKKGHDHVKETAKAM